MSTIPDIRDLPIPEMQSSELLKRSDIVECVGEVSAAAIAVTLIIFDGEVGLAAAIGVMGALAGVHLGKKANSK